MKTALRMLHLSTDWDYVKHYTSAIVCEDTSGVVAVNPVTGELYGAVVFDQFTPNSAQSHVVITKPIRALKAGLLNAAAHYVYNTRKVGIIYGLTPSSNETALKFDKHIGWREKVRLKDAFSKGVDYVVFEMRREDCRWLKPFKQANPYQLELVYDEAANG